MNHCVLKTQKCRESFIKRKNKNLLWTDVILRSFLHNNVLHLRPQVFLYYLLLKVIYNNGPLMDPCGTPEVGKKYCDSIPLHITEKIPLIRYDFIIII